MAIQIEIDERQMMNMSEEAKKTLSQQVKTYAEHIVKEANLIEEGNREDGANGEITSSIILQAVRKYKSNSTKKKDKDLIVLKIVSAFSMLLTGFLFDVNGYQGKTMELILFIIVLIIACVSTVLEIVKEA